MDSTGFIVLQEIKKYNNNLKILGNEKEYIILFKWRSCTFIFGPIIKATIDIDKIEVVWDGFRIDYTDISTPSMPMKKIHQYSIIDSQRAWLYYTYQDYPQRSRIIRLRDIS